MVQDICKVYPSEYYLSLAKALMKKVSIKPGCISCGTCQFTAPEVFEVTDVSHVKPNVAYEEYAEKIQQAVQRCPVQVISYEE